MCLWQFHLRMYLKINATKTGIYKICAVHIQYVMLSFYLQEYCSITWSVTYISLLVPPRCIITGMASGSIVLFYNDFNRWHHEYQTRYWRVHGSSRTDRDTDWDTDTESDTEDHPDIQRSDPSLSKALFSLFCLSWMYLVGKKKQQLKSKRKNYFLKRALLSFVDQIRKRKSYLS